jgi:hypothetical protein
MRILSLTNLISILLLFPLRTLSLQEKFEVDPSIHEDWLQEARDSFNPSEWEDFDLLDSLEDFLSGVKSKDEVFVFFYDMDDPGTYSIHPFFRTSSMIMKQSNPNLPTWIVDMKASPQIPQYFGMQNNLSCVFFFYKGAPILFKFDQMEKTKKPIDQWMREVKQRVNLVKKIEDESNMDVLENSNRVMLMIVDEEHLALAETFSALGFNYPELSFSYMVRSELTRPLEKEINETYNLKDEVTGSKSFFPLIYFRPNNQFQLR